MGTSENVTFVVPVNDYKVYKANFCASPLFAEKHHNEILTVRNYSSASKAYNISIEQARNDLIVFSHQDIYLPETWLSSLQQSLSCLDKEKFNWGVLGCFGSRKGGTGGVGRVYTTGMGIHGRAIDKPEPVETLDEIVLVIRKSSGLRFDPSMPHFHLYGTDICMSAREKGLLNYAIPAFCVHNTNQILNLPKEFYECYHYIKRKWGKYLPIATSCITISRFDGELHQRRIRAAYRRLLSKATMPTYRAEDPRALIDHLLTSKQQNE